MRGAPETVVKVNYAAGQQEAANSATRSRSRSHTPTSKTFVPVGYLNT
jgi:hypothetical protein